MAFYELEPFGDMIADLRHGTAAALLANINRDSKSRPEPYLAEDFVTWRRDERIEEEEPVLLEDPVAQSNLLRAALFGLPPK
jgi:hypothetical protein